MALHEYEVDGQTFLFDEEDPLLPKNAKRVQEDVALAKVPDPVTESVQDAPSEEDASTPPADANPAPVEESHKPKARRRPANKAVEPEADKSE